MKLSEALKKYADNVNGDELACEDREVSATELTVMKAVLPLFYRVSALDEVNGVLVATGFISVRRHEPQEVAITLRHVQ